MVVQPAARGPEEVQGVQPERLGKASSERETVAWALQKEKHSCAGKELEAEDPHRGKDWDREGTWFAQKAVRGTPPVRT